MFPTFGPVYKSDLIRLQKKKDLASGFKEVRSLTKKILLSVFPALAVAQASGFRRARHPARDTRRLATWLRSTTAAVPSGLHAKPYSHARRAHRR